MVIYVSVCGYMLDTIVACRHGGTQYARSLAVPYEVLWEFYFYTAKSICYPGFLGNICYPVQDLVILAIRHSEVRLYPFSNLDIPMIYSAPRDPGSQDACCEHS